MANQVKYQLRKDIFDYLKASLPTVDVVPEHPTGSGASKPKLVVTLARDQSTGQFLADRVISNPEIQLTCYASKELDLTKPTGLLNRLEELMLVPQPSWKEYNYHKIRDTPTFFAQDPLLYCSYFIYRFYTATNL